jgi:hypothetical protein
MTLVRNAGERCMAFKLRSSDDREIAVRVEYIERGRTAVDGEIYQNERVCCFNEVRNEDFLFSRSPGGVSDIGSRNHLSTINVGT